MGEAILLRIESFSYKLFLTRVKATIFKIRET